jgi:hypothetical protein
MKPILVASLVVVIFLTCTSVGVAGFFFNRKVNGEVEEMFADNYQEQPEIFTEEDLTDLPVPVQNWLRQSGVIGREKIRVVRLKQEGKMKIKPDGKWLSAEAEQYFTTAEPAFIWQVKVNLFPFVGFVGRDKYENGSGNMLIKLLSLIPVVNADGPEIDQATLLRYLGEMIWFPTAAVSDYIDWEAVDDTSAQATMSYGGITASAVFEFNDQGEVVEFRCQRYYTGSGESSLEDYIARVGGYREFAGRKIPARGEAVWQLESGEYSYYQFEITEVDYNQPEVY